MELFPTPNVSTSYENEVATLTISSIRSNMAGIYRCLATNDAGDDEIEAKVTVKGRTTESNILLLN